MPTRMLTTCFLIAIVISLFAHPARTGPVFRQQVTPDDVMSLADLIEVHVEVAPLPSTLNSLNITLKDVESHLIDRLMNCSIQVVTDEDTPQVKLQIEATSDNTFPDAYAFCATLSLLQPVHVKRVDRHLHTPTYHHTRLGLFPKKEAAEMILMCINLVTDNLANKVVIATEQEAQQAGDGRGTTEQATTRDHDDS